MEDKNSFSKKVVDLKPVRGDPDRSIRSKFGQFNTDDELLQSTARIKNQRDVIMERIQKMQSSHDHVSATVFEKVKRDYALQLETINELLCEKKDTLKKQVKDLYVIREKVTMEINRHKEILEEASFRHHLGEFTQQQYQEVEAFETKEIEKLEGDLATIYQLTRMHEELFDPEDLGLPPRPRGTPAETAKAGAPRTGATAGTPPEARTAAAQTPAPTAVSPGTAVPQGSGATPTRQAAAQQTTFTTAIGAAGVPSETGASGQTAAPAARTQGATRAKPTPAESEVTPLPHTRVATPSQPTATKTPAAFTTATAPTQAVPAPIADDEDIISGNEFAALFSDDEAEEKELAESQSNIGKILGEKGDTEVTDAMIPEPPGDDDYFQKDKVNESSYNVNVPEITNRINSKDARQVTTAATSPATTAAAGQTSAQRPAGDVTKTMAPPSPIAVPGGVVAPSGTTTSANTETILKKAPAAPLGTAMPPKEDDSISEILESIHLDGEEEEPAKPTQIADAKPSAAATTTGDFKLTLIEGELDTSVFMMGDNTSIGRSPSNDITLKAPKVSRQHAAINKYNNQYIIIDLKSSNGVYVNGAKIDEYVLHEGDEVSIGGYRFKFERA